MADVKEILEGWEKQDVGFVRFELPDMHGISRSKTVPIAHAVDYAERGLNMYGGVSVLDTRSDVVGGTLYHEEKGYGDQLLFPDPDSAAVLPWADRTARLICDAQWYDGSPLEATPRSVFRRALEKSRSMGFEPVMGSGVRVLPPHRRHARAALHGLPHLQHGPERLRPHDPPHRRGDAGRSASTSSRRTASTPGRSGRSTSRPAAGSRSGQRVHVQERREGDRQTGRLPRDVHDEAVGRQLRERLPHAPLPPDARTPARTSSATRTTRRGSPTPAGRSSPGS